MPNVSGAVPLETRCAVHCCAASRLAVEITSEEDRCVSLAAADSTTRAGVTVITFVGGVSNSDATSQLQRNARPASEIRAARVLAIDARRLQLLYPSRSHGSEPRRRSGVAGLQQLEG